MKTLVVNILSVTVSKIREDQYIFSPMLNFSTVFQTYLKTPY